MKSYIIKILSVIGLVIGLLFLIIKGLLLTIKANGGLLYPKEGLLYTTWGIFGVAIIFGIIILSYVLGNKKSSKKEPDSKTKKDDKVNKEPTFIDFVVLLIFLFFLVFAASLVLDMLKKNWKGWFYTEKKNVVATEYVVIKEQTQCRKEENWEMAWEKPCYVLGNIPERRKVCSKVKFLRKNKEVVEFIAIADGSFSKGSHFILTSNHKEIGRKWRGEYYDQISKISGWAEFDEVDNEYIGEHSTDRTGNEWVPTIVRLKK